MKKIISSVSLLLISSFLLSGCSAKSFSLNNIKKHLIGSPTVLVTPAQLAKPTTSVSKTK